MKNDHCDLIHPKGIIEKKTKIIDGITIKNHADGKTMWSKGLMINDLPEGYWEWYRVDGTLKRTGNFEKGEPIGEWITYNALGEVYKVTQYKK